ncbi:hypothetical protein QE152_g25277 [Popillia japonica]|uniref:Uncharacterized protein n=1 Tax=Popillia japonica TaxID=7064 RepID=A0AAW1K262_POPJA
MGSQAIQHRCLVADIEDKIILGMDVMSRYGLQMDLKHRVVKINNEELVLHQREDIHARVVVAENIILGERSETLLEACMDRDLPKGNVTMLEPMNDDRDVGRGIVVAKSLIQCQKTMPVRVMNLNYYPVTLQKGTVLGWGCPISAIVHKIEAEKDPPSSPLTKKLLNVIDTACKGLKGDEQRQVKDLINRNF